MRKWWTNDAFPLEKMKMCATISENKGTFRQRLGCLGEKFSCFWEWWTACFVKSKAKERKVWGATRDEARVSTDKGDEERKKRRKSRECSLSGKSVAQRCGDNEKIVLSLQHKTIPPNQHRWNSSSTNAESPWCDYSNR